MRERGQGEVGVVVAVFVGLILIFVGITGLWFGWSAVHRYQDRANRTQARTQARYDANNEVAVNAIKIRTFEQKVKIAKQSAQIRLANAVGVRKAQDEISSTLTPLYVQFEMVDALRQIAVSGKNSTVVYIPSGEAGIPFIQGLGDKVGGTNGK